MNAMDMQLPDHHQNIVDRFTAACQACVWWVRVHA